MTLRSVAAAISLTALSGAALAGCSTSSPHTATTTTTAESTASAPAPAPGTFSFSTPPPSAYPQDASALAARVPGCNAHPLQPSDSSAPGFSEVTGVFATASSAVACAIRGATVVIFAFSDAQSQARNEAYLHQVDAYYASGAGWTAAPENLDEPVSQQSLVQDVAISLGGRIRTGNG